MNLILSLYLMFMFFHCQLTPLVNADIESGIHTTSLSTVVLNGAEKNISLSMGSNRGIRKMLRHLFGDVEGVLILYDCSDIEEKITFSLYTRENIDKPQMLRVDHLDLVTNSSFNAKKRTYFLIHGFVMAVKGDSNIVLKNALLSRYDANVIAVDWDMVVTQDYEMAVLEAPRIGYYIALMIKFLRNFANLDLTRTHLCGYSIGAHIAGFTGKNLKGLGLARITGLDPASPHFSDVNACSRLNASDAEFVDVIHTNCGVLGITKPIGKADFYLNGGKLQPRCFPFPGCSHCRSVKVFSLSVNPKNRFKCLKCTDIPDFIGTNCVPSDALMGEPAKPSDEGIYYVKTSGVPPYVI